MGSCNTERPTEGLVTTLTWWWAHTTLCLRHNTTQLRVYVHSLECHTEGHHRHKHTRVTTGTNTGRVTGSQHNTRVTKGTNTCGVTTLGLPTAQTHVGFTAQHYRVTTSTEHRQGHSTTLRSPPAQIHTGSQHSSTHTRGITEQQYKHTGGSQHRLKRSKHGRTAAHVFTTAQHRWITAQQYKPGLTSNIQ